MKEEILKIVDRLKELGYEIDVIDKRPEYAIIDPRTIQLDTNTELENLTAFMSHLVMYKTDPLDNVLHMFKNYLAKAERIEEIKLYGEFPQDILDIVEHIKKK